MPGLVNPMCNLSAQDIERMRLLRASGLSIRRIGELMCLSKSSVHKWLTRPDGLIFTGAGNGENL